MKIKELELNNFRGFEHLKIQFPENKLAVFIGTNGSGKSSVLDALAKLMSNFLETSFIAAKLDVSIPPLAVTDKDINFQSKQKLDISLIDSLSRKFSIEKYWNGSFVINDYYAIDIQDKSSIPVLTYYRTNRLIHSQKNEPENLKAPFPQLFAYKNSLTPTLRQFNDFISWFKKVEDDELRQIRNKNDYNYRDSRLEVIRHTLDLFLGKLTTDVYKSLHIKTSESASFEFTTSDFFLAVNKNGQDFDIRQLSDGEKTLIMLVCDIARRLTIANPALENKLEGEGVVMIDEIELHLHPAWQRNVLPALQATFPNIQFIVTTHSPHVLNNVDARNIFLFRNENNQITCEQPDSTLGRDVNWILEEVMGVSARPKGFDPVWEEVQELISAGGKENLQKAKLHIEKLLKDFELADDGELNAKLAIIKRKEVLGR